MKRELIFGGASLVGGLIAGVFVNWGFGLLIAVALFSFFSIFIRVGMNKKVKQDDDRYMVE